MAPISDHPRSGSTAVGTAGGTQTPGMGDNTSGFSILGISGRRLAAVLIGWFFVVFDGYDLIVYGTVQTELMEEWNLNSAQAGTIGSTAFLGMVIGAVWVGRLSDRVGRKFAVIGSVVVLSVFTLLCAFAISPWMFGAFRLLAGIGLGGLVPSVNAMTSDLVPRKTMSAWATVMMSGVPLGGSIAAVLAQFIVPSHEDWGWRFMFLLAIVPLVIGLPIAMKVIPSDQAIREDHAAREGEDQPAGFKDLLTGKYMAISIWFSIATFVTLLAWYGLGTWLPRLMQTAGYDFGAAFNFTLALNLGAILGSVVTAWAGDRFGPLKSGAVAAGVAGVALLLLLSEPSVLAVYVISATRPSAKPAAPRGTPTSAGCGTTTPSVASTSRILPRASCRRPSRSGSTTSTAWWPSARAMPLRRSSPSSSAYRRPVVTDGASTSMYTLMVVREGHRGGHRGSARGTSRSRRRRRRAGTAGPRPPGGRRV